MSEKHPSQVSAQAAAIAAAIERWPQWFHRRYETIAFEGINSIQRSVRLDLSIPRELAEVPGMDWICVPLIPVPKTEAASVRVTEETGAAVMTLTSVESRHLMAEALVARLRKSSVDEGYDDLLTEEAIASLFGLVCEDDPVEAQKQRSRWKDHLESAVGVLLLSSETGTLGFQLSSFTQSEIVFVALPPHAEGRRMLTVAHPESLTRFSNPGFRTEMGRRHLAVRSAELLGWRDTLQHFRVPDGGISETLEIAARVPEGVGLQRMVVHVVGRKFVEVGSASSVRLRAPQVLHTRVSEVPEDEDANVLAFLRSEPGYPATVAGASLVSAVVLTAGALGLDRLNQVTDAAVTLLLAGPTLFASLIALPGRGRLAAQTVRAARALLGGTAAATFVAALVLVTVPPGCTQEGLWVGLTVTVWAITAVLVFGVLLRIHQIRHLKRETSEREREKWKRAFKDLEE